jgi:cytochrome c-type biogenesis protein CcmE
MNKRGKLILPLILMTVAFSYLLFVGMKEGSMYYLEVGEFIEQINEIGLKKVRINGEVVNGSLKFDSTALLLAFSLKDTKRKEILDVIYKGTPPDLIEQEGVTLVAEGSYDRQRNIFMAKKLLVKCPSKYEKKEVAA